MRRTLALSLVAGVLFLVAVAYVLPRDIPVPRTTGIAARPASVCAQVAAPRARTWATLRWVAGSGW